MPDSRCLGRHANQRRMMAGLRGDLLENLKRRVNLPHLLLGPLVLTPLPLNGLWFDSPGYPHTAGVPRSRQAGRSIPCPPTRPVRAGPWADCSLRMARGLRRSTSQGQRPGTARIRARTGGRPARPQHAAQVWVPLQTTRATSKEDAPHRYSCVSFRIPGGFHACQMCTVNRGDKEEHVPV